MTPSGCPTALIVPVSLSHRSAQVRSAMPTPIPVRPRRRTTLQLTARCPPPASRWSRRSRRTRCPAAQNQVRTDRSLGNLRVHHRAALDGKLSPRRKHGPQRTHHDDSQEQRCPSRIGAPTRASCRRCWWSLRCRDDSDSGCGIPERHEGQAVPLRSAKSDGRRSRALSHRGA